LSDASASAGWWASGSRLVVDEPLDDETVLRVAVQNCNQLARQRPTANKKGPVREDPTLPPDQHDPHRDNSPQDEKAQRTDPSDQKRRDGLLLMAQRRHRGHSSRRGKQSGQEKRQLIENTDV
jgi:hypothetical protein